MKVKVLHWNEQGDYHYVRNLDSLEEFRVDLVVSGELGDIDPHSLTGKVVEYERDRAYIRIAHGVKIAEVQP